MNNKTIADTYIKSSTKLFYDTVREHRAVVDWLNARSRNFNCGCHELLDAEGKVRAQPHFHSCDYIHARNRHIPKAIEIASGTEGFDRRMFSNEMDRYGRSLL